MRGDTKTPIVAEACEPSGAFYGERSGVVRDPFKRRWIIGHSIADVAPEEMQQRYAKLLMESE